MICSLNRVVGHLRLRRTASTLPLALVLTLAAAGCGEDAAPTVTSPGGSDATYEAGPFKVAPGSETVMCSYVRGENETQQDLIQIDTEQSEGGHHLNVYVVDHPIDLPPGECPQGGQPGWTQVVIAQLPRERQSFPPGVGFRIKPHQQFVIETHYINATSTEREVKSSLSLTYAPPGTVTMPAATYMIGSINIDVPPGASFSRSVECSLPSPISLHTMFAHQHQRGTGFTVGHTPAGGGAEDMIYKTSEWEAPPVETFEGGRQVAAGDTIRVTCDWTNESPARLRYPHEMCYAIGLYWPSNGGLFCASGGGVDDCYCSFITGALDAGQGGSEVEVSVGRADVIDGVKGDMASGAPVYCFLYRSEDWAGSSPKESASWYYNNEVIDAPLETASDQVTMRFSDVTPGDYVVTCLMDTIGGGWIPGSGDVVNASAPGVTAVKGSVAKASVVLDAAVP